MPTSLAISAPAADLSDALRRRGLGDVLDTTKLTRALYSSDASVYRVVPQAVARPRTVEELLTVLEAARSAGMPVTTRGAGTSCAGNAVGPGLVVDVARHLNRIHEVDPEARTARGRSRRGAGLAAAGGRAVRAAVRTRPVHPHPLHDRRHDRQQRLRTAGAGLRQDRRQRDRPGGRHRLRRAAHAGPARPVDVDASASLHALQSVVAATWARSAPSSAPSAARCPATAWSTCCRRTEVRCRPVPGRHRGHPGA